MRPLLAAAALLAAFAAGPAPASAACQFYTNAIGATDINCSGRAGGLSIGPGSLRGGVGGQPYGSITDAHGITRGRVDNPLGTYTDSFGTVRGSLGGRSFESYTDSFGNARGRVGGQSFTCTTDSFGTPRCR